MTANDGNGEDTQWTLEDIIEQALPEKPGQEEPCLMRLARGVLALELQAGADFEEEDLQFDVLKPWLEANRFRDPALSEWDLWLIFRRAKRNAKKPLGVSTLRLAWRETEKRPVPQAALRYANPEMRQLVLFCQEMQRLAGEGHWWLSCRDVQRLWKLSAPARGNDRLWCLEEDGIIQAVDRGKPGKPKATRYRYLYPLEEATLPREDEEAVQNATECSGGT